MVSGSLELHLQLVRLLVSANSETRRFSGDEAFLPNQRDASQRDAGVELGVIVEGKNKPTKL